MVNTQPLQAAPQCISGIAEVAASRARARPDGVTHALDVASYFPLDVETVSRMLEGLAEREGVTLAPHDELLTLRFDHPDDYNLRELDLERGEHMMSNLSLLRHLSVLRADPDWLRRVVVEHELLRVAAEARQRTLDLTYFTSRSELPSAKIQSLLNDWGASGHITIVVDEDSDSLRYTFPTFHYPRARYQRNMELLRELPARPTHMRHMVLWTALALVLAIATVVILMRM